ncbi:hypothetical protein GGD83_003661 [Rhodoblastus sphagnicola]|nr:plasmid pRiA4b ORF-3 family protein [Rhodoblastus sphagnicola]MBB4199837.1 hypothetical protein [Rhodoblastus sphagnicola]
MQFKFWLLGLSPMIWRRVHVPATFTLRQLHGVIQIAMGWGGFHLFQFRLRAIHYGSWELSARSPDITLESLRLRKGARFAYDYDLIIPWRHEIRLEELLEPVAKRAYPFCVEGHEACPPEDCGGPSGFLARRDAWLSDEGLDDLATVADFIDQVALKGRRDLLKDEALIEKLRDVSERLELRHSWQGQPFSRKAVNARLKSGDHLALMHQRF